VPILTAEWQLYTILGHKRSLCKSDPSWQSEIFADPPQELSGYLTNEGMKSNLA
jgi:hypothetical protein